MTVALIDTHAHLDDEKFQDTLPPVLERAWQAGLEAIITIGTTADSSFNCVELARQYDLLWATVGIQPNHVAQAHSGDWDRIVEMAGDNVVVGLGETGLDRYWDYTPFEQQEDYFARHLKLARQLDLPVVIHCREAEADTVRMLREDFDQNGPVRGVMHSFAGALETALACLDMGLHISFAGMVTYKNAQNLRDIARKIPRERLLVETDSPYLSPVPMRGKCNEPAFVLHTAACLAKETGMDLATMAKHTTDNAQTLFRLKEKKGKR